MKYRLPLLYDNVRFGSTFLSNINKTCKIFDNFKVFMGILINTNASILHYKEAPGTELGSDVVMYIAATVNFICFHILIFYNIVLFTYFHFMLVLEEIERAKR